MLNVKFTPKGAQDLEQLPKEFQTRIIKKLQFFSSQQNPLSFAVPLVNLPPTTHRFRVGDYRIAFYIDQNTIYVDRIDHRSKVYLY